MPLNITMVAALNYKPMQNYKLLLLFFNSTFFSLIKKKTKINRFPLKNPYNLKAPYCTHAIGTTMVPTAQFKLVNP
jgi:hypothetical protein